MGAIALKMRRGEGRGYSTIHGTLKRLLYVNLPQPQPVRSLYRGLYAAHHLVRWGARWLTGVLYREPALRARCVRAGKRWHVDLMPLIVGHPEICIGDDLSIYGVLNLTSGRIFDHPKVVIGDGVDIGHQVHIVANREVIIGDHVNIASRVYISDTDAHPRDPEARAAKLPPPPEEVRPVRISSYAWLGQNCMIMKGVTIGEGAVIGAASVVISDVPPYSVAMGNPARVVIKGRANAEARTAQSLR